MAYPTSSQFQPYHSSSQPYPRSYRSEEIAIAVMGVTGAGKSYFIKEVSGSEEAIISDGLESFTPKIMTYRFPYAGSMITLVDTPGFNDTFRTDADVLEDIAEWLEFTYRVNFRLRGIIYLHRISNIRMEGTAVRSLVMLRKLCGDEALQNMVLTTTHWSNVNKSVGNRREEELLTNPQFWGGLVERGAKVARFDGDRGSGLALIDLFMSMKHKTVTLAIQDELVNKQKELRDTAAGIAIHDGLKRLVQQYEASLRELRKEWTEVARTQNGELDRILAEEQRKLRSEMSGLEVKRQQLMVGREERVKIREQQWQEKSKQMSAVYRERQRKLGSGQLLDTALYRNQLHLLPQRPVLLVYAKATTEVGNVGVTGEWFSQKLKRALPRQVAVQGADYNALTSPLSLLKSGSDSAARAMVDAVDVAIKSSPTTKVVLSGYSQGGMIVRKAVQLLTESARSRITAIVLFGDASVIGSKFPRDLDEKVLNLRLPFDWVHLRLPLPVLTLTHFWYPLLSYDNAVDFIVERVRC